jgi:cytochrome b561
MLGLNNQVAGVRQHARKTIQWFNSEERFGLRAQLFHALIASLMIFMLAFGFALDFIPDQFKRTAYILHKATGLWILALSAIWFVHWLRQTTPAPLPTQERPQYRLAKLVHRLLLVLCILMPLSGWIMSSARSGNPVQVLPNFSLPAIAPKNNEFGYAMLGVHVTLAWSIIVLSALHIAGALYHHIIKRDPILTRMIPRFRPPAGYYRYQFDRAVRESRKNRSQK